MEHGSHAGETRNGRRRAVGIGSVLLLLLAGLVAITVAAASPAAATLMLLKPTPSDASTFVGHGGYSADGLGQSGTGGTVQAEVPSGSTVVQAYLYGTYFGTPEGRPRTARSSSTAPTSRSTCANSEPGPCCALSTARGDVTNQVKAKVGSGGGVTNFAVNTDPANLDGVALVVLFSNPALPRGHHRSPRRWVEAGGRPGHLQLRQPDRSDGARLRGDHVARQRLQLPGHRRAQLRR